MPRLKSKASDEINTAKLERKHLQEQQKRMKPGECLKFLKVVICSEFLSGTAGSKVLSSLANSDMKYEIRMQKVPRTILWERSEQQTFVQNQNALDITEKYKQEKYLLYLMYGQELVEAIQQNTLAGVIKDLGANYPQMSITIMVFGLKEYCRSNDSKLSRMRIETSLTELQILHDCNSRLHETADEVAATIVQFTKAISEIPYKKQQSDKFTDANVFLLNDNKDCVRVEGSAGLSRLWQQHLTRLPLVTLETAEAVLSEYPCPKALLEKYHDSTDGAEVLSDVKVRRAGGPLQSVRRIGPELSKKIYALYTTLDPNEIL